MSDDLFSLEAEKNTLGGFLKFPRKFFEHHHISEDCFFHYTHRTIFSVVKHFLDNNKDIDVSAIADYCRKSGLDKHGKVDVGKYIHTLSKSLITEGGLDYFIIELLRFRYLRDVAQKGMELQKIAHNGKEKDITDIVREIDSVSSSNISNFFSEQYKPTLIGDDIDWIEELGENPVEFVGYETPFPRYNAYYGGLRNG